MIHDVMVIGAGAAGATAAAFAAARGLRVVLIERAPREGTTQRCPDWLTAPVLTLLDELGAGRARGVGKPFDGAVFYPADLARSAETSVTERLAFRVDYTRLVRGLRTLAAKMGVECVPGAVSPRPDAGEDHVTALFENHDPVRAKFMLIADGAGGTWADEAGFAPRWIADVSARVAKADRDTRMHWVLGLDGGQSLACWWFDGPEVIVRLHGQGTPESVREQLESLLTCICERSLLPENLAADELNIALRPAPARLALEIDSHVGKRALRIGDAGGFFAAASREGIYPAMWSARLAVDVLVRAADSRHPQDELRRFGTLWRTTMAEYLRPPNTDTQFLLPLIFSNQQIADRMAGAFWHGENI